MVYIWSHHAQFLMRNAVLLNETTMLPLWNAVTGDYTIINKKHEQLGENLKKIFVGDLPAYEKAKELYYGDRRFKYILWGLLKLEAMTELCLPNQHKHAYMANLTKKAWNGKIGWPIKHSNVILFSTTKYVSVIELQVSIVHIYALRTFRGRHKICVFFHN